MPLIVTASPTAPEVGDKPVMPGTTVKPCELLAAPRTVTMTGPLVAVAGTGATMLVLLQLAGVAVTPLKVTVLVPWVSPKFEPVIVIAVPTGALTDERLLIAGGTYESVAPSKVTLAPLT